MLLTSSPLCKWHQDRQATEPGQRGQLNDGLREEQSLAELARNKVVMMNREEPRPEADVGQMKDGWLGDSSTLIRHPQKAL